MQLGISSVVAASEALPLSWLSQLFSELELPTKSYQFAANTVQLGQHWAERGDCYASLLHKLRLLPTIGYESHLPPQMLDDPTGESLN